MIMEGENEQSVHCDCVPPLRGVDYWTPEDVAAMESENKAYIIEELAKRNQVKIPVVQSVEEMTDTNLLYLMVKDGSLWYYAYAKTVIPGGQPLFDNALPTAIDSSGNIYNGVGYKRGTRVKSDGTETTDNASSNTCTGFIAVTQGKIIYLKGFTKPTANGMTLPYKADFTKYGNILYPSDWTDEGDGVYSFTADFNNPNLAYIRMTVGTISDDAVVSVGKPIAYTEPAEIEEWTPVQPLIYTDHTQDIKDLQETASRNSARIANLEQGKSGTVSIREWDKPIYDTAPVTLLGDERIKKGLTDADRTVEAIYAKYDALLADHPRYITAREPGQSAVNTANAPAYAGHEVRCYEFREPDGLHNSGSTVYETKTKIILMSGVHKEWAGIYSLYYAMEEITTNPDFDDIRRNAHIIVIPCANPFALSGQTVAGWSTDHVNANGVAIHNNFGVDHSASGTVGASNYGGAEAYSEPETVYINDVVKAHSNAVAFVSCHNNDYDTVFGSTVIWASSATPYMCNLAFRLADKLSKAWLADERYGDKIREGVDAIRGMTNADGTPKYPNLVEGEYRLGRAMMSVSAGTEEKNALQYNMQGVNLEVAKVMRVFNDDATVVASSLWSNAAAITHGAEVYANFIRAILGAYQPFDKRTHGFLG